MDSDGSLTRFAHELYSPDAGRRDEAARQLWLRFSGRLAAVVRRRLDARVLRRAGLDDVLQSLFASYFAAAPGPNGPPRDRDELWRRLVRFAVFKVANTADHHRAGRRDVRRERLMGDYARDEEGPSPPDPEDLRRPSPEAEVACREEFARLLAVLPEDVQRVFAMRVEGLSNAEIAREIGRGERTVALKLRAIRGLLRPHLEDVSGFDAEPALD